MWGWKLLDNLINGGGVGITVGLEIFEHFNIVLINVHVFISLV